MTGLRSLRPCVLDETSRSIRRVNHSSCRYWESLIIVVFALCFQKRPSSTSYDSGPHKKQRIAHYRKEKKSKEGKAERMEKLKEEVIKEEVKEEKVASPAAAAVVTNGRNEVSTTTPDSSHHRHKHRTKHKDKDSHRE